MRSYKLIGLVLSAAMVVGVSAAYGAVVARAEVHGRGGVCLDVRGGGTAQFTPLQVWSCVGNDNQLFSFTDVGEMRDTKGMCIDVQGGATANGTPVELHSCNGTAAQKWTRTPAGAIIGKDGKCLDLKGGNTANGSPTQIWDCGVGNVNQQWTLKAR